MNRKGTTLNMKKSSIVGVKPLIGETAMKVDPNLGTLTLKDIEQANDEIIKFEHDQLLQALYWIFDAMERALINFYLVGTTAESVRQKKDLFGGKIMIAVRKNEWESGARNIIDAFAPPIVDNGTTVEYEYNGVPVILYVLEDSETLSSFDTTIYAQEYFKLPNPYDEFVKKFEWLK